MSIPNQPGYPSGEQPEGWQPHGYGSPQNPQMPPPSGYGSPSGYPPPQRPDYPPPQQPYGGYPSNPGYSVAGYGVDPQAPFGRDPATGLPLSDRTATTAGLLQLFFGVFGLGRFYIDSTQIAIAQLCLGMFGFVFSIFCFVGFPVLLGSAVWAVVDAIMIFTGSVRDDQGRKLR